MAPSLYAVWALCLLFVFISPLCLLLENDLYRLNNFKAKSYLLVLRVGSRHDPAVRVPSISCFQTLFLKYCPKICRFTVLNFHTQCNSWFSRFRHCEARQFVQRFKVCILFYEWFCPKLWFITFLDLFLWYLLFKYCHCLYPFGALLLLAEEENRDISCFYVWSRSSVHNLIN